jgi:plastocyanin
MYRRALKLTPLVFAAALLAASPSTAANHIVTVGPDTAFHPDTLTIDVGDTVTWMNAGGTHDVHADDNSFFNLASGAAWTFSHTFTAPGEAGYHCTIHGGPGVDMFGTITVQGSGGNGSQAGSFRFSLPAYTIGEAGGAATIVVQRINGDDGAVSVQYSATGGTATAGQDFSAVSGTLSWAAGDNGSRSFNVPVVNDGTPEADETILLTLSNPTGGATLHSTLKTATLTIDDNDSQGGGSEGFLTTSAFPDFRFRLRIYQGDQFIFGRKENACLPETLCVSGAVAGRSEVFVRIIGPRPNGFLWPTIVRFTPSRVVVEIQQISTGTTNTYELPAVPPDSDELSGFQDRTGFLP